MPPKSTPHDSSSSSSAAPLADYFFIAGIDSDGIFDGRPQNGLASSSPRLSSTIEEHPDSKNPSNGKPRSPTNSPDRRSKRFSWDPRKSTGSLKNLEPSTTKDSSSSARSSATIKATLAPPDGAPGDRRTMTEEDFDAALKRFALDRDNVISEIQFSAGQAPQPSKPAPTRRPKTQRFTTEDVATKEGGVMSGIGSVKRRLSTMNRLQKSGTVRRASTRMSKRVSGYNSVIPAPQRFQADANMHPLKRPYEPVLLDQYPSKDMAGQTKPRVPFPDYVPMFVFPNDVNVISCDERPRSTWHGFAMTAADGSRLHGITIILWIPLKLDAAQELERQCEEWRQRNMSPEERELANSLGERLAAERAKLSELLSGLAASASDELERERKEEEISMTEEKISLMADMLRPVRLGAAAKIEGLTDGETGMWMPRAYGVLGREATLTSFWKEWLRAIAVPMSNGAVLRVPPSSPRVGMWQPLERYVVNLCAEAVSPIGSKTQVELAIRELRMYARKEAINEVPGSRNTDLYALFRSLDIPVIVTLFEFLLAESRIILLSSHTSMLHLASAALVQLLYPFKWQSVFIPVLPARLIQALEAPCPYICGIERRYENVDIPDDDIVLVDLDNGTISATGPPPQLPRQQRRKLISILQLAAPHRYRFGVPVGPPAYAKEVFPHDIFASEIPGAFKPKAEKATIAHLANLGSASFGSTATSSALKPAPMFSVFAAARANSQGPDRPNSNNNNSNRAESPSSLSPPGESPVSATFPPLRNDSSNSLQMSLREKRSGRFDNVRRSSNVDTPRPRASSKLSITNTRGQLGGLQRPNAPFSGAGHHHANSSISTVNTDPTSMSSYAPSVYAQSTLAASTIMPYAATQHVHNTETTQWVEGHCMRWRGDMSRTTCSLCDEKGADEGMYRCSGCATVAHGRCLGQIYLVCPDAFHPDQVIAAFVRCFGSLLYTYRKHMSPALPNNKGNKLNEFNREAFLKSLPRETADYVSMLVDTQAFTEFIYERETKRIDDATTRLFDDIILSKRNRGRASIFSKSTVSFLADTSDHLWRSAASSLSGARTTGFLQQTVGRTPAKLERALLKDPRVVHGVPRISPAKPRRKQVPSMLGQGMQGSGDAMSEQSSEGGE